MKALHRLAHLAGLACAPDADGRADGFPGGDRPRLLLELADFEERARLQLTQLAHHRPFVVSALSRLNLLRTVLYHALQRPKRRVVQIQRKLS